MAYFSYAAISLVSAPVYIAYLGISGYGLLSLLNSILAPLGLLNLGFGEATIKYVAEHSGRGDQRKVSEYIQTTLLFNIGVGILGAVVIGAAASFLVGSAFRIEAKDQALALDCLSWIAIGWFVTEVSATFSGIPAALQKYRIVSIGQTALSATGVAVGLITLLLGGNLLALVQVKFIWSVFTAFVWLLIARRLLPQARLHPQYHREAFRSSFRFGVWQTVATVGGILTNQADKYMLGIFTTTSAVGLFSIPANILQIAYQITAKLSEVLFPAISSLQGRGEDVYLGRLMIRSTGLLSVSMTAIMGGLFIFAHDILQVYVGAEIADSSASLLRIMVVSAILSSPAVGFTQYLLGTGKTTWLAFINITSGLITVGASLVLVPYWGLHGAAWSDLIAIILSRPLVHFVIWRKHLRATVSLRALLTTTYGPAFWGVLLTGVLAVVRDSLVWIPSLISLIPLYVISLVTISGLVISIESILPGSEIHLQDMTRIVEHFATTVRGLYRRLLLRVKRAAL